MATRRTDIPKHELEILARHFLSQIQTFFESEEGKTEFAQWQAEQAKLKALESEKKS